MFTDVTVLLSDMVGFTTICSTIKPMDVARLLNAMYMTFDSLVDKKHSLYKVVSTHFTKYTYNTCIHYTLYIIHTAVYIMYMSSLLSVQLINVI